MENIRAWAMGMCAAALVGAILLSLTPKNGIGKLLSVLTSVFFLTVLVAPLSSLTSLPPFSLQEAPQEVQDGMLTERYRRQLQKQMEDAAFSVADSVLSAYGYHADEVEIGTDISEEGYIYMDSITVFVDSKNAAHSVAIGTLLENRFGIPVTVKEAGNE